ncbi:MAG TPA: trimethylamine methyltransferase family protein [Desulfobacteraceae bacterium]|nr:trimethylamine methyltransferase family protein [Desulfobacteraceae bacterium]
MKKRYKKILRLFDVAVEAENLYQFQKAKKNYQYIVKDYPYSPEAAIATSRIEDMDLLAKEKRLYRKIDKNARRVLTEIGMDIANSPELMQMLMDVDAIDFDNETALFVPLKEEYIEECLDMTPAELAEDPGENAFGTGATPPFLWRRHQNGLAPANAEEFKEIVKTAERYTDTIGLFSLPVQTDKTLTPFQCATLMEKHFSDLKMTYSKNMSDDEMDFFHDKEDWLDGTSLITSMTYMPSMVRSFMRTCRHVNNVLLLDLTIAGSTGPASPEALLTQVHAQVLFMIVVAQTINPGICCVHGGIPDVLGSGGDLDYSDPGQPIINSAMARLNMWVTGLPSAQSGGSTSVINNIPAAVAESTLSRNTLRQYGAHIVRHSLGALGSLNFFSLEKFIQDCEQERITRNTWLQIRHDFVLPLHLPEDRHVIRGIREIMEKGGPKNAQHTLNNIDSFNQWHGKLMEMARKKVYYPDLDDTVKHHIKNSIRRTSPANQETQLQNSRKRIFGEPNGENPP